MKNQLLNLVVRVAEHFGGRRELGPDVDPGSRRIVESVRPLTMTSDERILAACEAAKYVAQSNIAGDVVECGVWRGGSMVAMLKTLVANGDVERDVFLYDTFEGMSEPTALDKTVSGAQADSLLRQTSRDKEDSVWCIASLEDVRENVEQTGYPAQRIRYVKGKVEDTIPQTLPGQIALLRLDTDWYESTKHELEHLFPRLVSGGVLILDDYGHWEGARLAVDEYLKEHSIKLLLNRIDYTGRIAVKP